MPLSERAGAISSGWQGPLLFSTPGAAPRSPTPGQTGAVSRGPKSRLLRRLLRAGAGPSPASDRLNHLRDTSLTADGPRQILYPDIRSVGRTGCCSIG